MCRTARWRLREGAAARGEPPALDPARERARWPTP